MKTPALFRRVMTAVATVAVGAVLASSIQLPANAETPQPPKPKPETTAPSALVRSEDRGSLLGSGWKASADVVTTAIGDSTGFTIYKAAAKTGYAWQAVATLTVSGVETDRWIGNTCLTEDGSKMGVVYGTRTMTNEAQFFDAGAWGAIVDMKSGEVTSVGRGFSLAYFNPGCGEGNDVLMSAFTEDAETRIVRVDANAPKDVSIIAVDGEITSAIPTADGVVAAAAGAVVSVGADGSLKRIAKASGVPYGFTLAADGGLAYMARKSTAASAHFLPSTDGKAAPSTIARGPLTDLGLSRGAGKVFVHTAKTVEASVLPSGLKAVVAAPAATISSKAELVVENAGNTLVAEGKSDRAVTEERPPVRVFARSAKTNKRVPFAFDAGFGLVDSAALAGEGKKASSRTRTSALVGSPTNPIEAERTCAIARNNPKDQAMQPQPRHVEWAVNQAVTGSLTKARTSAFITKAGLSATPAQATGMFPRLPLSGGGRVPSHIMLGIIAQESNMWQASRYATPGVTGNPLIGNYYGNIQTADRFGWTAVWASADCGYGVAQVTDGMRLAGKEKPGEVALSTTKQRAVALDYATNIAAGLQILTQKWNQTRDAGLIANGGNPAGLESWFFAVWAYNSGFYPKSAVAQNQGAWGVGWSNNPVNPKYLQNRLPFLSASSEDARNPQNWPYPEKVMGFAAYPPTLPHSATESRVGFRQAWWSSNDDRLAVKPPVDLFCKPTVNDCDVTKSFDPATPGEEDGPCGHKDSSGLYDLRCWWHGPVNWKDCSNQCGNETLRFAAGYTEEADGMAFPPACTRGITAGVPLSRGLPSGALIVDDTTAAPLRNTISATSANTPCVRQATEGTFAFTFGADANGYPSKIDTHQLGAGFNSHFYFAHTRQPDSANSQNNSLGVTGKWTLGTSLTGKWTRVYVHVPDHAAWTQQATYRINLGNGAIRSRTIQQRAGANDWISLGVFQMQGTPSISLSNLTRDGEGFDDIAWDAVAFQPLSAKPTAFVVALGDSFSSGEGASNAGGVDFYGESDNNGKRLLETKDPNAWSGDVEYNRYRNACHRSTEAWSRKAILPGMSTPVGKHSDDGTRYIDYHLLACSGAETEHVLPYFSTGEDKKAEADRLKNAFGQTGVRGKYRELSQLDAGFLDSNTTLVTISIGGNDAGFGTVVPACVSGLSDCNFIEGDDGLFLPESTTKRINEKVRPSVATTLREIHKKAPNAKVLLMGYPRLFEHMSYCVLVDDDTEQPWLSNLSLTLSDAMSDAVDDVNLDGVDYAEYANPMEKFAGRNLCSASPAVNGFITDLTPGDDPIIRLFGSNAGLVSAQSIHPNKSGTTIYGQVMTDALK